MATKPKAKEGDSKQFTPQEFLQDQLDSMSNGQRLDWLDANAHSVQEEEYRAPLTIEEIEDVKAKITKLASKKQELEDKKKAFMDELNVELKPIVADLEEYVREARQGERNGRGKVWYLPDVDAKITFKVAEGNVVVGSRPIRREELEGNLFGGSFKVITE